MGIALTAEGDLPAAAEYFRKALEVDPEYRVARANLEKTLQSVSLSRR
jgi:lipoprotein NlpI